MLVIRYDWRNNSVLFVHNLDGTPREIAFATGITGDEGKLLVNLLAEDHSHADARTDPSSGYFEPDAQPASITPYTPMPDIARMKRTPIGSSATWR